MSKIILITGASSGIGALSAIDLAKDNQMIIHYCASKKNAEQVALDVQQRGGTPHLLQADLTSDNGCITVANFIEREFGKLDVLINNAGGLDHLHPASDITWPLMERIFALNTFSVMRLSSLCIPFLRKGTSSCIINITSVSMRTGAPTATVYASAKAAIDSFTKGLAGELAPQIRVNAIAPGYIDTPFHYDLTAKEALETIAHGTPLQRIGKSQDISSAIQFLIQNEFMTGATIDVNGGLFMH